MITAAVYSVVLMAPFFSALSNVPLPKRWPKQTVEKFEPITLIPKPFPAIKKFPILDVTRATNKIQEAELVIGVTVGKESRAYPMNMLTGPRREILNDTLGGKAIAVTW